MVDVVPLCSINCCMLAWPSQVSGNSPVYLGQWGNFPLSHFFHIEHYKGSYNHFYQNPQLCSEFIKTHRYAVSINRPVIDNRSLCSRILPKYKLQTVCLTNSNDEKIVGKIEDKLKTQSIMDMTG